MGGHFFARRSSVGRLNPNQLFFEPCLRVDARKNWLEIIAFATPKLFNTFPAIDGLGAARIKNLERQCTLTRIRIAFGLIVETQLEAAALVTLACLVLQRESLKLRPIWYIAYLTWRAGDAQRQTTILLSTITVNW